MKRIGERIKSKRSMLNIPLNDLAKKVGVSPSAISQIEKAKAFPSIFTLKLIADNLHTTVGELIGENDSLSNNPVVYKDSMKFVEKNNSGTELYIVSHHDVNKQMDTYFLRMHHKSNLDHFFKNYHGQIFCHIISGTIEFCLDDKYLTLHVGDNIYFNSTTPYSAVNNSAANAELIWVMSPPGFQ